MINISPLVAGVPETKEVKSHAEVERIYSNDCGQTGRAGEMLPRSGGARSQRPGFSIVCRGWREPRPITGGRSGHRQGGAGRAAYDLRGDGSRRGQAAAPPW